MALRMTGRTEEVNRWHSCHVHLAPDYALRSGHWTKQINHVLCRLEIREENTLFPT